MTLTESLLRQLDDPALGRDERAQLRCRIAAAFEYRGQYEAARDALGELWQGIGQRPALEGLNEPTAAEVLLRAGTLSGWLGSAQQIEGAQDAAKDLISESITRFQALGVATRIAAAQGELGFCYRRAGAYDEARVMYNEAIKLLNDGGEKEPLAIILLRLAVVESCSGRYNETLRILTDSAKLFEESTSDALKGKFHNELACVLVLLSKAERRSDYTDRAIIEYTAASHHFQQAGHSTYHARAENNLGFLLYTIGRYGKAHKHLKRARFLFVVAKDEGSAAQVDETRARVLLAEGRTLEAERTIRAAVRVLARGGEQALLAEALTTQGRVLAQRKNFPESQSTLKRAADLAEVAGAVEDAGRALLTLIEEHAERLDERELFEAYDRADSLLRETQDAETIARLHACASRIVRAKRANLPPRRVRSAVNFWADFDLNKRVHAYEARYIQRALLEAEGGLTRAARLLGIHYATLAGLLDEEGGRHKQLSHLRTPPEPRRQSIIGASARRRQRAVPQPRAIRILHVEDNRLVAAMVRDTLQDMGWTVETCIDGGQAMKILAGDKSYDLLIFDNELGPGQGGIELIRHTRTLPHRQRTPIIMLSGSDVEPEAWRAGADAFLRKPEDVRRVAATVSRLLTKDTTGNE